MARSVQEWLRVLRNTFPRGEANIQGYLLALEDIGPREMAAGCKRVLRTWGYTFMPPPAEIRNAVAAELEIEDRHKPRAADPPAERLSLEEAWIDWEETLKLQREMKQKLGLILKAQGKFPAEDIQARRERLKKQAEEIVKKYGKGPTI